MFKLHNAWVAPVAIDSISPWDEQILDKFRARIKSEIDLVRRELFFLSESQLNRIIRSDPDIELGLDEEEKRIYDAVVTKASNLECPKWYAAGFGVDGHQADFNYWAKLEKWSLEECIGLSIGFEPNHLFGQKYHKREMATSVWEFLERQIHLIKQKFFHTERYQDMFTPSPIKFCEWLIEKKMEPPDGLLLAVSEICNHKFAGIAEARKRNPELEKLEGRERESLLKMVIGLAIGSYGYDPNADRPAVAKDIQSDLQRVGLNLSQDTIRKWLLEAATMLPDDFKTG